VARSQHTPSLAHLEEALTVLFCLVDDAYALLNPRAGHYGSLKRLSDSEVIALTLFQQLRGVQSERSFLRDAQRFFSHLFPGVARLHPSSLNRRVKKLRRFLEPLRREILPELVGEPETLIVDSTLLSVLHPRQAKQSAGWGGSSSGAAWVRWGSFSVYGVKLHLLCATNSGTPLLRAHPRQRRRGRPDRRTARRERPRTEGEGSCAQASSRGPGLPKRGVEGSPGCSAGILLVTERSWQGGKRQQVEIALASLKREFRLGETLATTLVGLATRIAAKVTAYTYGFYVNRMLGRPQGHIKELWA
jgi:hypothetical protein